MSSCSQFLSPRLELDYCFFPDCEASALESFPVFFLSAFSYILIIAVVKTSLLIVPSLSENSSAWPFMNPAKADFTGEPLPEYSSFVNFPSLFASKPANVLSISFFNSESIK